MANWYSTDWRHRLPLTIPHGQFSGDVALTLPISGLNLPDHFWSKVKADGTDIVVASSDGVTKLKRQIAYINTATKVLEVYVQWPSLSASVDTPAWLYYGNPAAAETDDADTWPAEWVFASPMADYNSGTQIKDFSQYANHGTKGAGAAAPTEVAGLVGMAQEFVAANGQYISLWSAACFDFHDTDFFSVLCLVRQTSEPPAGLVAGIVGKNYRYGLDYYVNDHTARGSVRGTTRRASNAVRPDYMANDTLLTMTYTPADINGVKLYVDGTVATPASSVGIGDFSDPAGVLHVGHAMAIVGGSGAYFDGLIDEIWLSSVALSPDEIAAIDAALRGSATFYGVGAYEHRPLYIMQGYRRMTDGATATPQTYRRAIERTTYAAQGYRRLTTAAEYITQAYRRLADKALYTIATKRRLRTLYRILGRPSYAMDHRPRPDYGLGPSGRANDRHR